MSKVIALDSGNFEQEVRGSTVPVLVDYWAPWCGPCRVVAPILEEIAEERDGTLKVGKVDVDTEPGLAASAGMLGIPYLVLYRDGEPVAAATGACSKAELEATLGLDPMQAESPESAPGGAALPLGQIEVATADGEPCLLGELVSRPTILIIPRYYGCLPCRDYLTRVSRRLEEVRAAGGDALAVSVGAPHQARWLVEERGVGFPLLCDPERRVYDALELPRRWWVALNPRGWLNYATAIARGNRQGRIVEPNQLPGLALLDAGAAAVWVHRGRALGDYPPLDEVLEELRGLAAGD